MTSIPLPIVQRMERATPYIMNALSQLEVYLAEYNFSLYAWTEKHIYLHDFSLMFVFGDLASISSQLRDAAGRPITEHIVAVRSPKNKANPLLDKMKSMCNTAAGPATFDRNLVSDHNSPLVSRNGKHNNYSQFLVLPWNVESDPTPPSVTRSCVGSNPFLSSESPTTPLQLRD